MTASVHRSNTQDIAKAFGIFAVVFVHTWRGLISVGLFSTDHVLNFVDKAGMLYAMPVFFMLAGYNAFFSLQRAAPRDFIIKRAKTIIPIYVLWSIVQAVFHSFKRDAGNSGTSHDLLQNITSMWYHPIDQFWFLYGLMIYHVLAALLKDRPRVLIAVMVTAYLYNPFAMPLYIREMLCCGVFYLLGYLVARNGLPPARELPVRILFPVLGVLWVISIVVANVYDIDPRTPPLFASILCASAFIFLLSYKLNDTRFGDWLAVIGRASLAIYVMHVLFFAGTRFIWFKLGVTDGYIHLVTETFAGLFAPLAIYYTLKRYNLTRYALLG